MRSFMTAMALVMLATTPAAANDAVQDVRLRDVRRGLRAADPQRGDVDGDARSASGHRDRRRLRPDDRRPWPSGRAASATLTTNPDGTRRLRLWDSATR